MQNENLDLSVQSNATQSMNKTALTGMNIINVVLAVAYMVEVVKGVRTVPSYLIVLLFTVGTSIACTVVYYRHKDSKILRYVFGVGFSIFYTYVMMTASTDLTFCYALVAVTILMVYIDMKFLYLFALYALVVNLVRTVVLATQGKLTGIAVTNAEIAIACLVLCSAFVVLALKKIKLINQAGVDKADQEKEQSEVLLHKTLDVAASITDSIAEAVTETESLKDAIGATQYEMEKVTESANQSVGEIEIQKQNTEKIHRYIRGVDNSVQSITEEVQNAEDNLNASGEVMKELLGQVRMSESSNALVAEKMTELKECANRMHDIMELISSVADQTGLLALNASIEAARAGEAGRGFAVVASEISNLSAQTNSATGDINELIDGIVKSVEDMTASVDTMLESSRLQNQYVDDTAANFDKIRQNTRGIAQQVSGLQETVDVVLLENKRIQKGIENVSDVTQKVMDGANETLAVCNTNLKSVAHVAEIMDALTLETAKLQND